MNRRLWLEEKAKFLERQLRFDPDWCEKNQGEWEHFDKILNDAYNAGELTDHQFDVLALTAFYDYLGDLKGEY